MQRLGRYQILRHIATGGMAEIYLARIQGIEGFEKLVVVKRIRPELAANPEMVKHFLDEVRLSAALQHPNIVQVYDIGMEGTAHLYSMEFVHGEDVRTIARAAQKRDRPISYDEAITIVLGMCAGLHYAHEKTGPDGKPLGIIHRDVSPSNVMVSFDGAVRVADFGIAKAAGRSTETRAGVLKGKYGYMSPEQIRLQPLDRRSDVFAIAIVLYELTTGARLFDGQNDLEIMAKIVAGPPPAPELVRSDFPEELARIIRMGLARDPAARYQTAQEMQLDLEIFARGQRLAISPLTLSRLMHELFADRIEAWRKAELEGKALAEHLVSLEAHLTPTVGSGNSTAASGARQTPPPSVTPAPISQIGATTAGSSWRSAVLFSIGGAVIAVGGVIAGITLMRSSATPAPPALTAPATATAAPTPTPAPAGQVAAVGASAAKAAVPAAPSVDAGCGRRHRLLQPPPARWPHRLRPRLRATAPARVPRPQKAAGTNKPSSAGFQPEGLVPDDPDSLVP